MNGLENDLERLVPGGVLADTVSREIYATAACVYRVKPRAVVRPRDQREVRAVVAYARERGMPVTARGGGSAVAGQTLGPGIVIDFKTHMNKVLEYDPAARRVVVEPGITLGELNRAAAPDGLRFPPDPSSGEYATLGGMIANNSSGARSIKHGSTRDWTRRLKVALSDGSLTWLDPKPALPAEMEDSDVLENRIYSVLPRLLDENAEAIGRSRPRVLKNSSGYHVWDLLADRTLDPVPLLAGSEGTLAVTVKAELELAPLPAARMAALLNFADLDRAALAVMPLRELEPSALEIMDHMLLSTVREHRPDLRGFVPEEARASLLVEFEGDNINECRDLIGRAVSIARDIGGPSFSSSEALDEASINRLFQVRKAASPILYRMPGRRLTRFVEDVVFPPEKVGEGIKRIREILADHGTEAPILGHAGSGNLHLNPRLNLEEAGDREKMKSIADAIYGAAIEMGGSISGEHGDGMLRAPYVKKQFPLLTDLFRGIKELFDPAGIMNPGKILSEEDSIPLGPLRFEGAEETSRPWNFPAEAEEMEMLLRCHGCGLCRNYCPVARAMSEEAAMPRSKISALRAVALGDLDLGDRATREGIGRILGLCTMCQRCLTGCPTGIEPALLIRRLERQLQDREGRPLRERFLAATPNILALASKAPAVGAAALGSAATKALSSAVLAISPEAPAPRPTPDALRRAAVTARAIGTGPGDAAPRETLVLYPGCVGRYADGEGTTNAAVMTFIRLGYEVSLPDLPCCGELRLSTGDIGGAAARAKKLALALMPFIERGLRVVTTCQACALTIRHEYPRLLPSELQAVCGNITEAFELLAERAGDLDGLRLPEPRRLINHRGCHQAALSSSDLVAPVMGRVGGLELISVEDACCGLAGCYGMRKENAEVAGKLAAELLAAAEEHGVDEVLCSCPGCRIQIENIGLRPVSPLVLLAGALANKPPSEHP